MEQVFIGAIGKCPRCFEFLQLPDEVPLEHMPTSPQCMCGETITAESQGMVCVNGEWTQIRWLNKFGRWTESKPTKPFILLGTYRTWLVLVDYGSSRSSEVSENKPLLPRPRPRLVARDGELV